MILLFIPLLTFDNLHQYESEYNAHYYLLPQVFAQRCHKDPKTCHICFPASSPDFFSQIGMCQNFPNIFESKHKSLNSIGVK